MKSNNLLLVTAVHVTDKRWDALPLVELIRGSLVAYLPSSKGRQPECANKPSEIKQPLKGVIRQ